ncbi:MAG: hypothetical protein ABSE69_19115, partial [Roseiarcus sp.]
MRVTLAAITDDRNFLALDEVEIGITIVVDAHVRSFAGASQRFFELNDDQARKRPGQPAVHREKPGADQARRAGSWPVAESNSPAKAERRPAERVWNRRELEKSLNNSLLFFCFT